MLMKRLISLVAVLMVVTVLLFSLISCQKEADEKKTVPEVKMQKGNEDQRLPVDLPILIVTDGEIRDLGEIREGVTTQAVFTLKNVGNVRAIGISVHDLSKGGCTAVSKISQLAAGDSARLVFKFETLGHGGKDQTRQIKVRYNNHEKPPIILTVKATILPTAAYQVPIGELFYNFFVLVDIRDVQQFKNGHIVGAIHVPVDELDDWIGQLPRSFMIYLYSDDGILSDQYALQLQEKGYSRALSIVGGLEEWKKQYGDRFIITGVK